MASEWRYDLQAWGAIIIFSVLTEVSKVLLLLYYDRSFVQP